MERAFVTMDGLPKIVPREYSVECSKYSKSFALSCFSHLVFPSFPFPFSSSPPPILIPEFLCDERHNCSGHGSCVGSTACDGREVGKCRCNEGYGGTKCAITVDISPNRFSIQLPRSLTLPLRNSSACSRPLFLIPRMR